MLFLPINMILAEHIITQLYTREDRSNDNSGVRPCSQFRMIHSRTRKLPGKSYHSVKVFFVINKRLYSLIQNIKYNLIKLKLYHGIPFFQVCTKFVFTYCNVLFHFLHEDHPLFKILKSNICFLNSTFINESLCQN